MPICQCGCEMEIPSQPHHTYQPPRFLFGHYQRTETFRENRKQLVVQPPPDWPVPSVICECGCGQPTPIAKQTATRRDQYRGFPLRYLRGHNPRGKRAHGWKGGRIVTKLGYVKLWMPEHHLANKSGYVFEHRLVWEETHGRRLEPDEDVHHVDGNPSNNEPSNLIALKKAAHRQLHKQNGASDQRRARLSEATQRRYTDPAERQKTSEQLRAVWAKRKATR